MSSVPGTKPATTKLELRTAYGSVYRDVLSTPPRDCTREEIPILDLTALYSDSIADRKELALQLRATAVNTGFFYIKNHGIPAPTIEKAKSQLLTFFKQPVEKKKLIDRSQSKYFNGWRGARLTNISPGESFDVNESMGWRYEPQYDPDTKVIDEVPEEVWPWIRGESFVWEGTSHLEGFKEDVLAYWGACLTLARRLVKVFALSLDLPEDYFDSRTTYPGADGVFNYYPVRNEDEVKNENVGLGSHTDLQLFTLLWQDMTGGLQVLNPEGHWIRAPPIEGTIVVNIGDFMMRLCNDLYKSTVHRVFNTSNVERVSMPFFFGLNFNCVEGVIPTCTSPERPPLYEPISCGDWCQLRFQLEANLAKEKLAKLGAAETEVRKKEQAPSAIVVAA